MKFYIYNPPPPDNSFNIVCYQFHSKTGNLFHNFDCYREVEREPFYFQCSDRINELSEPISRLKQMKYEKKLWTNRKSSIFKQPFVSRRLEHLATANFRNLFTSRKCYEDRSNIRDHVKMNLNIQIQKSMYNMYSRLQNVKFPKMPSPRSKPSILSGQEYENRQKFFERLSQPRKVVNTEVGDISESMTKLKRPFNMAVIERLSIPRKIPNPDEHIISPLSSRPLKDAEYYQQLSQPKKNFESTIEAKERPNQKLKSMKRTVDLAVQWSRLQRRKFMKGDNDLSRFPISRAALQYQPTAKIIKLAVPKRVEADPNQQPIGKSKKKK